MTRTPAVALALFVLVASSFGMLTRDGASRVRLEFEVHTDSCRLVAGLVPAPRGRLPEVVDAAGVESAGVRFGPPARSGGIDVVTVTMHPLAGSDRAAVVLEYDEPLGTANADPTMARLMFGDDLGFDGPVSMPGYLVVTPDEFYANVIPLAEWKRRSGFHVWVRKLSETGSTREQIRDYIRTAYTTWTPRPAFVLLVGAANKLPPFVTPGTSCVTDHIYACVDGSDYLADLFVGRLPAANSSELDVMVAKLMGYEATPYVSSPEWFSRALMVGTSYQEGGSPAVTALVTLRRIREQLLGVGYSRVDTVFYPPTFSGRGPIDTAVNRGVLFVNGRGWGNTSGWGYPQFNVTDVNNLANGWRLPVVTSIYCGTGNFVSGVNPCFGEAWLRAGTPGSPKGGVAFWGSSYTGTSTRWNNCMDFGIYDAIFRRGIRTAGAAMYAGKLEQLANFPLADDTFDLRLYFHVYNLFGDPAMEMWTEAPRPIQVMHPSRYHVGGDAFEVLVRDGTGLPLGGARVCVYKPGEVHDLGVTDGTGRVCFGLATQDADTLYVTVTGPNLQPYLGAVTGAEQAVYVAHETHSPAVAAPGGLVNLEVALRNYGSSQTAEGVTALLRSSDGLATITDSVRQYGDIGPGQSRSSAPFALAVSPACTSGQQLRLQVRSEAGDSSWLSAFELLVSGPTLAVRRYTVHDANGVLDPGEEAEVSVVLGNRGDNVARGVTGVLRSANPNAVRVIDSAASFGDIAAGDSGGNLADRFRLRAAPQVSPGRRFSLELELAGSDGFSSAYRFAIVVGQPVATTPLGPDFYGYYAYDNTDAGYSERPEYSWVEIDPAYGGQGARINVANDRASPVNLPFAFRFYGNDYGTISVADNGYLAFGSTWLGDPYNWHIPSASGPDGFVAVFWDDFRVDTLSASGVYTWHDAANHRFVVEWSRCLHVHGFRQPVIAEPQTFEVILLDPQYHATRTGDGAIVAQYHTVLNDDSAPTNSHNYATAGVQNPGHSDGVEYTFAGAYPGAASVLATGRAVKYTTNPPDTFYSVAEAPPMAMRKFVRLLSNPVRGSISLESWLPAPAELQLVDVAGRVVLRQPLDAGWRRKVLPLAGGLGRSVPAGVYRMVLSSPVAESAAASSILVVE